MVTHDLRDLLGGLLSSAKMITEIALQDERGRETLVLAQRIERSARRMNRLIGDLVDVASIDAGKLMIVATVGDAVATAREAVDAWMPNARSKGVELQAIEAGRVLAQFDSERVLQILGNLISNAVKFSPAGTIITVGLERIAGEARFWVRDCGVGIPADKLEAIFERFWQIGKHDRRGLGLGLYIAQCIATAHGGRIWAESTLGAGSTFFFTVPALQ